MGSTVEGQYEGLNDVSEVFLELIAPLWPFQRCFGS